MSSLGEPDMSVPQGVSQKELNAQSPVQQLPQIMIITGQSGAGRTKAAAALEDMDWYVVDNLPPHILTALAGLVRPDGGVQKLAAVVDVRSGRYFNDFLQVIDQINAINIEVELVFLEAQDKELVRRYEQSRRPHPLQKHGTILQGIASERELIKPLRLRAQHVIDTTTLSVHDLARKMRELVAQDADRKVKVSVMSFGFKHGLPLDANHVIDVRFIPNPYWVSEIRNLTGCDEEVANYVFAQPGVAEYVDNYVELLLPLFPAYEREIKANITIAVGCTGGRHRSVAITEQIAQRLVEAGINAHSFHRDIGRE